MPNGTSTPAAVHPGRRDIDDSDDDPDAGDNLRQREPRRAVGARQIRAANAQHHHRQSNQQIGDAPRRRPRRGSAARCGPDRRSDTGACRQGIATPMAMAITGVLKRGCSRVRETGQRAVQRHAVDNTRHGGHQRIDGGAAGQQ